MSSSFSFTNTTAGTSVPTTKLAPSSSYAKTMDEPTEARLSNKSCTLDQGEIITYRCREIANVATVQQVLYPARVQSGVEYGVRLDELLRTKDSDGNILCDEPIVATLTIKNPKSSNITDEIISQVVARLLGACYNESEGRYRWGDLMRSALVPAED